MKFQNHLIQLKLLARNYLNTLQISMGLRKKQPVQELQLRLGCYLVHLEMLNLRK